MEDLTREDWLKILTGANMRYKP
ncbi:hypothetical protein LCGC14_2339380, partial [marine sediment metagenome]